MRFVFQAARRWLPRDGMSIVEVIVALLLLAAGMLAVTSAGSAVIKQLRAADSEVDFWGALQTVGDSLQQLGYDGASGGGTREIGRYNFMWTVDDNVSDPALRANEKRITLAGWAVTAPDTVPDITETLLIYLTN